MSLALQGRDGFLPNMACDIRSSDALTSYKDGGLSQLALSPSSYTHCSHKLPSTIENIEHKVSKFCQTWLPLHQLRLSTRGIVLVGTITPLAP
jgi:hypothetical protein